ncbi:MAG: hypothetical protein WCO43_05575 [Chitinophagia bacterium]
MKHTSYIGFIMLAGIAFIAGTSCSKDFSGEFTQYPNNPLNDTIWTANVKPTDAVNTIVTDLMPAFEKETLNLENTLSEIKVGGNDSFRISFAKGIFTSLENGVITPVKPEGTAEIQIFRIRRTGDLIKCMRSTQSSNVLAETVGGFFIKVIKDGKELSIADRGASYQLKWIETGVSNPKKDMRRFYAKESSPAPDYNVTDVNFEWKPDTDITEIDIEQGNSGLYPYSYYKTNLSSLRWVSLQRNLVVSPNSKIRLTTYFPPNFTNKNTAVFACYKNQKTMVRLNFDYASRSFNTDLLPPGAEIKIISISKIGSNYYLSEKAVSNLTTAFCINKLEPEKISLAKLQAYLDEQ